MIKRAKDALFCGIIVLGYDDFCEIGKNSELLMPSIDMKGHSYDDFLSAIERQGYYEIKNPRVYKPGTNEIVQVEGWWSGWYKWGLWNCIRKIYLPSIQILPGSAFSS